MAVTEIKDQLNNVRNIRVSSLLSMRSREK